MPAASRDHGRARAARRPLPPTGTAEPALTSGARHRCGRGAVAAGGRYGRPGDHQGRRVARAGQRRAAGAPAAARGSRRWPTGPTPRTCPTTAPRSVTSAPRRTPPLPAPPPRPRRRGRQGRRRCRREGCRRRPPPRPLPTRPRRRPSARPPPSRRPATRSGTRSLENARKDPQGAARAHAGRLRLRRQPVLVPQLAVDPREQLALHRDEPVLRRIRDPAGPARLEDGQRGRGLPHQPRHPDQVGPRLHPSSVYGTPCGAWAHSQSTGWY